MGFRRDSVELTEAVRLRGLTLVLAILATAATYVATARIGLAFAVPPDFKATAIWPPSGIALAALLLWGWRLWPGIFLGAFVANFWDYFAGTATMSLQDYGLLALAIAAGSTLQALMGAFLIQLFIPDGGILASSRSVAKFIVVVPLACTIAPTVGLATSAAIGLSNWDAFAANWPTWWIGDAGGIFLVTPFILSWVRPTRSLHGASQIIEAIAIFALVAVVSLMVFGNWSSIGPFGSSLPYMTVPPVILAKYRLGPQGATTSLLILSSVAIWGTSNGYGAFREETTGDAFTSLQAFLGITAVTILLVTGVLAEKRSVEETRLKLIDRLEQALNEIRTLQGVLPICAWCRKVRNDSGAWEQLEEYVAQNTDAQFSHGICPNCRETQHPPVAET